MPSTTHERAAQTAAPGVWVNTADAMPDWYEEVRVRDSENYERIARRSKREKGIWQFASFEREGSKYPWSNKTIVAWTRIYPVDVTSLARTLAAEGDETPGGLSATETMTDWVNCPVCGETDMARTTDSEGDMLIRCLNHCCASNGGLNHSALAVEPGPAQVPAGYEVVKSSFLQTGKEVVLIALRLMVVMEELAKAKAAMAEAGSNLTVFLLAGDKHEAEDLQAKYLADLREALFEYRRRQDNSTIPSSTPVEAALSPETVKVQALVRDFVKGCVRFAGKQVSGNDLAASATRLLERMDALNLGK